MFAHQAQLQSPSDFVDMTELTLYRAAPEIDFITSVERHLVSGEVKTIIFGDALGWWRKNEYRFPIVARLAKRYLAIKATSVPSESLFSNAGMLITKKRASLGDKTISDLMFIHQNHKLLNLIQDFFPSHDDSAKRTRFVS